MIKNISILFVSVLLFSLQGIAQDPGIVQGKITNEKNQPVELVNISIMGLSGGTISDRKGMYRIEVPSNQDITLVFSFIGYEKQEFPIRKNYIEARVSV